MPSAVVPVGMGCYHVYRKFGEGLYYGPNIAYAQTGIDEDRLLSSDKQIGMNFHPLPILTYPKGGVVQGVYRKPVVFQFRGGMIH